MHKMTPRGFPQLIVLLLALLAVGCGEEKKPKASARTEVTAPQGTGQAAAVTVAEAASPSKSGESTAKMAPTPATVTRETELKEKPFVDAKTLKRLPARTAVAIVDRSGGWVRVTSAGQQGWVRLLHVSSQPTGSAGASAKELESAAKIATGRAGSGNIVSTTGIRGLDEEQLREAKPNPAELQGLEGYTATKEQAAAYARTHKLERRQVGYLPEPR
jgi:hypothetical protein